MAARTTSRDVCTGGSTDLLLMLPPHVVVMASSAPLCATVIRLVLATHTSTLWFFTCGMTAGTTLLRLSDSISELFAFARFSDLEAPILISSFCISVIAILSWKNLSDFGFVLSLKSELLISWSISMVDRSAVMMACSIWLIIRGSMSSDRGSSNDEDAWIQTKRNKYLFRSNDYKSKLTIDDKILSRSKSPSSRSPPRSFPWLSSWRSSCFDRFWDPVSRGVVPLLASKFVVSAPILRLWSRLCNFLRVIVWGLAMGRALMRQGLTTFWGAGWVDSNSFNSLQLPLVADLLLYSPVPSAKDELLVMVPFEHEIKKDKEEEATESKEVWGELGWGAVIREEVMAGMVEVQLMFLFMLPPIVWPAFSMFTMLDMVSLNTSGFWEMFISTGWHWLEEVRKSFTPSESFPTVDDISWQQVGQ